MVVKKIGLAWITVADMNKAQRFFVDTLGLTLDTHAPEYGWMEVRAQEGDFRLGVGLKEQMNVSNAVLTFDVDNMSESKKELERKGVTFVGDIQEVPGHVKLATFQDSDGNMFQLVEKLDGK